MTTDTLTYIITIAQEKSLSKAADKLYMSQPMLSKHLKNVESEIGAKLFTRKHAGVELTDAGRIFVNNAKTVMHLKSSLEDELGVKL